MVKSRFPIYAWGVLIYNLPVIAFGAFVRASKSGDGCGSHWPLCNGALVPLVSRRIETLIEFIHRLTSGPVLLLLVGGLLIWGYRAYGKGHSVRAGVLMVLGFTLCEAALGAALVLFGWTAENRSVERAYVQAIHLCLTFLLLGSLTLTAYWASGGAAPRLRGQGVVAWSLGLGLGVMFLLGMSGAITALGDTLYPPRDSLEVLSRSMAPGATVLTRIRPWHPLTAVTVGLYLALVAGLLAHLRPTPDVKKYGRWLLAAFGTQMVAGLLNVMTKAPVAMQIVHLVLADAVWILLVLLTGSALAGDAPQREEEDADHSALPAVAPRIGATLRQYLLLTKPRVISLLLFTTIAAMFAAAPGWPGLDLLASVAVGGAMAAGAANCINMAIERDLDLRMKRTARRPTCTDAIPPRNALLVGFGLGVGSFALLWWRANLAAATLALAGLVCYVNVYTLMLKRRTWQNIVIGGAAGAFPPLVGWAAVRGDLDVLALYLFAIVFLWTPVHFWALALMIQDDYRAAGVPMLPVVKGWHATVVQIAFYGVLTVVATLLPLVQAPGELGGFYGGCVVLLNAWLLVRCVQLYRKPDRPRAVRLYVTSMAYLALLFLVLAIDRSSAPRSATHAVPAAAHAPAISAPQAQASPLAQV